MTQPDAIQEVLARVRRNRLVEEDALDRFLALLRSSHLADLSTAGVLSLMEEQGLLTSFQANELAAGRCSDFWIGSYRILDRLGRGGMGTVYLAEHALLGKRVAVKVLAGNLQSDPSARNRFQREARAAAALDHPNVVQTFDADVEHHPPYLVMEFVDGISLQAAVARHGPLAPEEAASVGMQTARGLSCAAALGITHRDVKPANVLIDRKGQVKILDLGIARFTHDPDSRLVDAESILGTLDYLAPEQAENCSTVDPRADMYALGATLYFLLTGEPPFVDENVDRKLYRKRFTDPLPLHLVRPGVPEGLSVVVQRLMARRPDSRFGSSADAADALQCWAKCGPDFPTRLFQRPMSFKGDSPGEATDIGHEGDPTPQPPTLRIVVAKPGAEPMPVVLHTLRTRPHHTRSTLISGEVLAPPFQEVDPPTVRLTRPTLPSFESRPPDDVITRGGLHRMGVKVQSLVDAVRTWLQNGKRK